MYYLALLTWTSNHDCTADTSAIAPSTPSHRLRDTHGYTAAWLLRLPPRIRTDISSGLYHVDVPHQHCHFVPIQGRREDFLAAVKDHQANYPFHLLIVLG